MKTLSRLIALPALLLLAFSCQQNPEPTLKEADPIYTASMEQAGQTKTSLAKDRTVRWAAKDRISVFRGNSINRPYRLRAGAGTTQAEFESDPDVDVFYAGTEEFSRSYAIYPYSEFNKIDKNGNLTFDVPTVQFYSPDGFSEYSPIPMVASTINMSDTNLGFRNVCGILKLSLTGKQKVQQIFLHSMDWSASLSGTVTLNIDKGEDFIPNCESGNAYSILTFFEPVQLKEDEPTDCYIAVVPTNFDSGVLVTLYDEEGNASQATASVSFSVRRNEIVSFENLRFRRMDTSEKIHFTDPKFEEYLLHGTVDGEAGSEPIDANGDGYISVLEAEAVTAINTYLNTEHNGITNLQGIEYFHNLKEVHLFNESIKRLDFTSNPLIETLVVTNCFYLESVDVSQLPELTFLNITDSPIETVDVSNNPKLSVISVLRTNVSHIDLSCNPDLKEIILGDGDFSELDLSLYGSLELLYLSNTNIRNLDVHDKANLSVVVIEETPLESLVVSRNQDLTLWLIPDSAEIICFEDQQPIEFTDPVFKKIVLDHSWLFGIPIDTNEDGEISVAEAAAVKDLRMYNNDADDKWAGLKSFDDLKYFTGIESLDIRYYTNGDNLELSLSGKQYLKTAYLSSNCFGTLRCNNLPQLEEVVIYGSALTDASFLEDPSLSSVEITAQQLSYLNFVGNPNTLNDPALTYLSISNAQLDNGLFLKETSLTSLNLENCFISSLTLPVTLKTFYSVGTRISVTQWFSFAQLPNLETLIVLDADWLPEEMDFSNNPKLYSLQLLDCNISSIDISANSNLRLLNVPCNPLRALDVSHCPDLQKFRCQNTLIETLDVSMCTNLRELMCAGNYYFDDKTGVKTLYVAKGQNLPYVTVDRHPNYIDEGTEIIYK